jgi:hypothetical protein
MATADIHDLLRKRTRDAVRPNFCKPIFLDGNSNRPDTAARKSLPRQQNVATKRRIKQRADKKVAQKRLADLKTS